MFIFSSCLIKSILNTVEAGEKKSREKNLELEDVVFLSFKFTKEVNIQFLKHEVPQCM